MRDELPFVIECRSCARPIDHYHEMRRGYQVETICPDCAHMVALAISSYAAYLRSLARDGEKVAW